MKKLLVLLAALGLMTQMTACKANNAQDDAEFIENADTEKVTGEDQLVADMNSAPEVTNSATSTDNLATDPSLEAALGETPTEQPPTSNETLSLDAAATETNNTPPTDIAAAPSIDENSLNDVPPPQTTSDAVASTPTPQDTITEAPPMDSALVNDAPISDVPMTTEAPTYTEPKPAKVVKAETEPVVKKVNTDLKLSDVAPYAYEGGFVNTVYIARPKEKLKDISQTIFGSNKTKELKKINTFLKAREVRAGDKIFYVSPNRPSDSARMITYYEDTGMVPETYVAKKGDDLKKISKNLLGYDKAWKEVWATNAIETKSKLSEGDTFRYWKSAATITTPPVAQNEMPQLIDNANQLPAAPSTAPNDPAMDAAAMNQPPTDSMAANNSAPSDLPPPPPADNMPPTDMAANPPQMDVPPAPPADIPPPPQQEAAVASVDKQPASNSSMEETPVNADQDMYTMLGVGVLVCGVVAYVIVRRKKRKAAEEMAMGETGVGI